MVCHVYPLPGAYMSCVHTVSGTQLYRDDSHTEEPTCVHILKVAHNYATL